MRVIAGALGALLFIAGSAPAFSAVVNLSKVSLYAKYSGSVHPGVPLPIDELYLFQDNGTIASVDPSQLTPMIATTVEQGNPPWMMNITNQAGSNHADVSAGGALKVDNSAVTQSANQTQVNGVAVSVGNGTADTGCQRVTVASNNTAFTVNANATQSGSWTTNPSTPQTYMVSNPEFVVPATPTDMLVFSGSGTKTVKIRKIEMTAAETTAGNEQFFVLKRSTADTTGTPNAVTSVPVDSANGAATATFNYYTANPGALGTSLGSLFNLKFQCPAIASTLQPQWRTIYEWIPGTQPITLRGTAESVVLNFAGAALPAGLKVQWTITYTEE